MGCGSCWGETSSATWRGAGTRRRGSVVREPPSISVGRGVVGLLLSVWAGNGGGEASPAQAGVPQGCGPT